MFPGVARVIITAKQALIGEYTTVLQKLVDILRNVAQNPSNPNFDQYFFESISGLIRFIGAAAPDSISVFEATLFPPFTEILQKDIDRMSFELLSSLDQPMTVAEYIPYVFQILAQMLTLHRGVPVDYRALLPFLLTPAMWSQKGSIPGLVALLRAFLARDAAAMVEANQHTAVLGIVQQRLVPSKVNDGWGFELLQSAVLHIPLCVFDTDDRRWLNVTRLIDRPALQPYFRQIVMTLLTRMQQNKTNNYVYYFAYFLLYVLAINVEGLTPDYLIQTVDEIQLGYSHFYSSRRSADLAFVARRLWSQIVSNFIEPQITQLALKDRKVAAVGLTRLLTQSTLALKEPNVKTW